MMTENELRAAFHDQIGSTLSALSPSTALLDSLRRRQRRRNRLTAIGAIGGVIAIAASVAGLTQLTPDAGHTDVTVTEPFVSASPPNTVSTATVPLIVSGDCAGLTVTATDQDLGNKRQIVVAAGSANTIIMPGNDLMYLQASGPCVSWLTFRTSGNLQGPDPNATVSAFNRQGTGVVVSKAVGSGTIELLLSCEPTNHSTCPTTPIQVAAIVVTVTTPNGVTATQQTEPKASGPPSAIG